MNPRDGREKFRPSGRGGRETQIADQVHCVTDRANPTRVNLVLALMSISQRKPDERALRFLKLCLARQHDCSDEEVASTEGLSPVALYRQLAMDGFPVCPACGDLHPDQEHRQRHTRQKRKAKAGGGKTLELNVAKAIPLFERALEVLREGLGGLDRLRLYLQDVDARDNENDNKRFVVRHRLYGTKDKTVLPDGLEGESVLEYRREQIEPQDPKYWRALCEEHKLDPEKVNSVMVPIDHDRRDGASPTPPEYLVAQIANHVLTGGDVEELLEALHPRRQVAPPRTRGRGNHRILGTKGGATFGMGVHAHPPSHRLLAPAPLPLLLQRSKSIVRSRGPGSKRSVGVLSSVGGVNRGKAKGRGN